MLIVKQLTRLYEDITAVNNVSFKINKGEIVGLLGHNGAGKTTIMKMLSGFIESNHGSIEINGVDIKDNPKKAQKDIGYLSENLPVYPEMFVADYLDYVCEIKGIKENDKASEIRRVIMATDIESKILSPISTLSRGYKQRVGIAQAILGKPKLLILDEPTNGLDPKQTSLVRELIHDLSKDATVILSTHIMQEVDALCSRALIVRDGQLVVDAELDELKKSNTLILSTSLNEDSLSSSLKQLNSISLISKISSAENNISYHIELKDDVQVDNTIGEISRLIITSGGALYSIYKKIIDLETLFKKASEIPQKTNKMEA
jgi:ABC-2 type transport system ATP-binding protein